MNKKQQLEQFFDSVELDNINYWYFKYNNHTYKILDYTLSNILSRDLDKNTLKDYLLHYATKK